MTTQDHDVRDALIIGAGPAGLTSALTLGRLRHTALVFDSGSYRNQHSAKLNLVLGWDGKEATEFRKSARQNILERYQGIEFRDVAIETLHRLENADGILFEAVDALGHKHVGRKVILATGAKDVFPPVEGFAECWAKGVYHCLICSLEVTRQPSAGVLVYGTESDAVHLLILARMALQYVARVTIYTNQHEAIHNELQSTLARAAANRPAWSTLPESPIVLDARPVARLAIAEPSLPPSSSSSSSAVAITFADGSSVIEGFVAHRTMTAPDTRLARMLGAELAPSGELVVGWKAKQTSVHGVFAAGDAAAHMKSVPTAQQDGMFAAWGLAMQVEAERLGHDDVDFADR